MTGGIYTLNSGVSSGDIELMKGQPNGLASLDSSGNVPTEQLPALILGALYYNGVWDCSLEVYPSTPQKGDYYICSVEGTISGTDYLVSDWLVYNGSTWDKIDNNYGHNHDYRYYTIIELDDGQLDTRYYTETEINSFLDNYTLIDGSRSFTGTVSGVTPTEDSHLATKGYVDNSSPTAVVTTDRQQPTGFVDRTESTLSFDDSTLTFSIAPSGSEFSFYVDGTKFTKTEAQTKSIPDTEGKWYFYFDSSGEIQRLKNYDSSLVNENAYIAHIYWDSDNSTNLIIADERHGIIMDSDSLGYNHATRGARYASGLDPSINTGNGNLDIHAQIGYTSGIIWDEDIETTIDEDTIPAENIRLFYKTGSSLIGEWNEDTVNTGFISRYIGGTRATYNEWTGTAWQQTEASSNGNYILGHVFAVNECQDSTSSQIIAIQGIDEYSTEIDARHGANNEMETILTYGLPYDDYVPLYTFTLQVAGAYLNQVKARIRAFNANEDWIDWRLKAGAGIEGPFLSHRVLTNLDEDLHPQYSLADGSRAFTGEVAGVTPTADSSLATKEYVDQINFHNIVTVGGENCQFDNIQDAISSITDASSSNRYAVQINPGTYTASNIVLKNYVYLIGTETAAVYLENKSLNTNVITFAPNVSGLFNVTIDVDYDNLTEYTTVLDIYSGFQTISRVRLLADKTNSNMQWSALDIAGGNVTASDFRPEITTTSSVAGDSNIQSVINITGNNVTLKLISANIRGVNNDSNDVIAGIGYNSGLTGLDLRMLYSEIAIDQNGNGLSACFFNLGDTTNYRIFNSSFDIDVTGTNNAYGGYINSTSGNSQILSTNCIFDIQTSGAGTTYGTFLSAGDAWESRFDDIIADQYYTGGGTYEYFSILQDGITKVASNLDFCTSEICALDDNGLNISDENGSTLLSIVDGSVSAPDFTPSDTYDLATKQYVDQARAFGALKLTTGGIMTLTTGGTYYRADQTNIVSGVFSNIINNGITASNANGTITVGATGYYLISASVSATATAGATINAYVYVNGVKSVIGMRRKFNNTGDYSVFSVTDIISISASQVVDIRFSAVAASKTITFANLYLNLKRFA